jgi:heat shock protein HslJ
MKKTIFLFMTLLLLALSACSGGGLNGEWKLVSYGDPVEPTPALPDVDTSISFNADGSFGGTVGCNTFSGEYTVSGNQVTFSSIVSTMMFCEEINDQESFVLAMVSYKTAAYAIDGNQLTITSEDGKSVMVLEKK